MARIRTFKPDFASDAKVARLTRDARLTFLLMFTEADDYGRLIGSAKRLAGALYPNDEDVTPKRVDKWVAELIAQGMVQSYEVDGVRYLWIVNFTKHQKIDHKTDSRLPEPPPTSPGTVREQNANGSRPTDETFVPGSRKLEVEVGSGNLSPPPAGECPPGFDDFWNAYPRRVDKGHARTAWSAALKKAPPELIVEGARRLASDPNLPAEKFIPHPTTWLRGERWDDPPLPSVTQHSLGRRDNGSAALIADIRAGRLGA